MNYIILEKDYGFIDFNNKSYSLKTSMHTKEKRGTIPRDSLSKTKYSKIINSANDIKKLEDKVVITWEHKIKNNKGLLVQVNNTKQEIFIITTILSINKNSDKILPGNDNRVHIKSLN